MLGWECLQELVRRKHCVDKVGCTLVHLVLREGEESRTLSGGAAWAVVEPRADAG